MASLRPRLTYANVVSTICLFLVLGGATAFAAKQLGKNSVGTRQLKKNAVTAAKIKKGAVTGAKLGAGSVDGTKLANGAVDGSKLADGAVTGGKLGNGAVTGEKIGKGAVGADNLDPSISIPHVMHTLVATTQQNFPPTGGNSTSYAFDNPSFTQPAGEDLLYLGSITATFGAGCKAPREFSAVLVEDDPGALGGQAILGTASGQDEEGTLGTVTASFGTGTFGPSRLSSARSSTPKQHTYSIRLERIFCATGSTAGATATAAGATVDIVGFR